MSSPASEARTRRISRAFGIGQSILLFAYAAAYLLDAGSPLIDASPAVRAIGAALGVAGLLLMLAAIRTLRKVIQVAPEPRAGGQLITSGVYARFRHPIYTAIVVVVIGLLLRRPTPLVALGTTAVIVFLAVKVGFEERLLAQRYPDYPAYRERTWGLVPWPRSRRHRVP